MLSRLGSTERRGCKNQVRNRSSLLMYFRSISVRPRRSTQWQQMLRIEFSYSTTWWMIYILSKKQRKSHHHHRQRRCQVTQMTPRTQSTHVEIRQHWMKGKQTIKKKTSWNSSYRDKSCNGISQPDFLTELNVVRSKGKTRQIPQPKTRGEVGHDRACARTWTWTAASHEIGVSRATTKEMKQCEMKWMSCIQPRGMTEQRWQLGYSAYIFTTTFKKT